MRGNFQTADTAIIDIVSDQGRKIHYNGKLCNGGCRSGELVIPFDLNEKTTGLEIRLYVDSDDRVSITGYEIVLASRRP